MSDELKAPEGWHIQYNPKPIPFPDFDYDFWHDNYYYADDTGGNGLAGCAKSYEEALRKIDMINTESNETE